MISITVCDDCDKDLVVIKRELENYFSRTNYFCEIKLFSNANALLYSLSDELADIYILDVSMPNANGFELAEAIRRINDDAIIIFLTSMENQAINGYKSGALRYILKINMETDLREALDNAISGLKRKDNKCLIVRHYSNYIRIPHKEISSVTKERRRIIISTISQQEVEDHRGLKEIYNLLDDKRFIFINRSCFVNIDCVLEISKDTITLTTGQRFYISRQHLQSTKDSIIKRWDNI